MRAEEYIAIDRLLPGCNHDAFLTIRARVEERKLLASHHPHNDCPAGTDAVRDFLLEVGSRIIAELPSQTMPL